jgi:periplasmic protein TonB
MDAAAYHLRSELARVCLPAPERDAYRRLAWANSVCIFFLIIGVVGARSRLPVPSRPPPIEQPVPIVIEPLPPPPPSTEVKQIEPQNEDQKEIAPQVVAVTLNTLAIDFSVPTIGNLVVPMSAAPAPPPVELRQAETAPVKQGPTTTGDTGDRGDRPRPAHYPEQARQWGQQGTVVLLLTVDDVGAVTSVIVKTSSGSAILDRDAAKWVKHHWIQPPINGSHVFQTSVKYVLE